MVVIRSFCDSSAVFQGLEFPRLHVFYDADGLGLRLLYKLCFLTDASYSGDRSRSPPGLYCYSIGFRFPIPPLPPALPSCPPPVPCVPSFSVLPIPSLPNLAERCARAGRVTSVWDCRLLTQAIPSLPLLGPGPPHGTTSKPRRGIL